MPMLNAVRSMGSRFWPIRSMYVLGLGGCVLGKRALMKV